MDLVERLGFLLNSNTAGICILTNEEDRVLQTIAAIWKQKRNRSKDISRQSTLTDNPDDFADLSVWSVGTSLVPFAEYRKFWNGPYSFNNPPDILKTLKELLVADIQSRQDEQGRPRTVRKVNCILTHRRMFSDSSEESTAVRMLLMLMQQSYNQPSLRRHIVLILPPGSELAGILKPYFEVIRDPGPTEFEVKETLENTLFPMLNLNQRAIDIRRVIPAVRGLTRVEMRNAVAQGIVLNKEKGKPDFDLSHLETFRQNVLRNNDLLHPIDTREDMSNLGGLTRFKAWAEETRLTWTDEGAKFGLKPPRGVLNVGVWGCGKSTAVKVLGQLWKLPVIHLEMGRIRHSHVGQSERNMYDALQTLDQIGKCLVWVDEAEKSFAGSDSSGASDAGTTSRMIGILSTWIQETKSPVCLALTANSVTGLPIEFINRMNERFFFDLPSEDERIEIIKIHIRKAGQDPSKHQLVDAAQAALDLVGREIEQCIEHAMIKSFHADKAGLDPDILLTALRDKPRIVQTMSKEIQALRAWVGEDPVRKDGIRARWASERGE